MFSRWKNGLRGIRGRLVATALLPLVGFVAISFFGLSAIEQLSGMLHETHVRLVPKVAGIGEMEAALNAFSRWAWIAQKANSYEERSRAIEQGRQAIEHFKKAQENFESAPQSDLEQAIYPFVRERSADLLREAGAIFNALERGDDPAETEVRLTQSLPVLSAPVERGIEDLVRAYGNSAQSAAADSAKARLNAKLSMTLATLIGAVLLLVLPLWGGLRLVQGLARLVSELRESGSLVTVSSQQLSAAGQELSSSSTRAAASLEQTVASIEELTSMVRQNAQNSKEAAALSEASREAAEKGEAEIQGLIQSMGIISESSKKIEEIISVIDDIAFQTNLLALNAAVEAARAGEQGKGFAVVAEAVRALAARSASAAHDVSNLIHDSVEKIDHGTQIADRSGGVLGAIVGSVKKVAQLNGEIAAASQEQSSGLEQISKAMTQLDEITQSNASSAEEVASSSEAMSRHAVEQSSMVSRLSCLVNGADADGSASFCALQKALMKEPQGPSEKRKQVPPQGSFVRWLKELNPFGPTSARPAPRRARIERSSEVRRSSGPAVKLVPKAPVQQPKPGTPLKRELRLVGSGPKPAQRVTPKPAQKPAPRSIEKVAPGAVLIPFEDDDVKIGTIDGF